MKFRRNLKYDTFEESSYWYLKNGTFTPFKPPSSGSLPSPGDPDDASERVIGGQETPRENERDLTEIPLKWKCLPSGPLFDLGSESTESCTWTRDTRFPCVGLKRDNSPWLRSGPQEGLSDTGSRDPTPWDPTDGSRRWQTPEWVDKNPHHDRRHQITLVEGRHP